MKPNPLNFILLTVTIASALWGVDLYAQAPTRLDLSGRVLDDSTGAPLAGVNVFLNNTTIGAATDPEGYFDIKNVPFGLYEMVVSMIGYRIEKRSIRLTSATVRELNFRLKSRPIRFRELEVVAKPAKNWKKNLRRFEKFFLGASQNASKCKIINPEILDFEVDANGDFSADASDWLEVENLALGYRVRFNLKRFEANQNGSWSFLGITQFRKLRPKDQKMLREWEAQRAKAYRGSLRHYLHALVSDKVAEEGFESHMADFPMWDDLRYSNLPRLKRASVVDTVSKSVRRIWFDHFVKATYKLEKEERNYRAFRVNNGSRIDRELKEQTSWFELPRGAVMVNVAGVQAGAPLGIRVYGYWAWERMAELLPADYQPTNSRVKAALDGW